MTDIFETVKSQVKIADVVEYFGVKLNSRDKGLCPFHREKTASFSVDRKNNIFTCFGCGETGDVITFVSKIKDIEPYEAAKLLAEIYHIDVQDAKPQKPSIKKYLQACMKDADKTDYFAKRGLTAETVKKFCLGFDVHRNAVVLPYSSELTYYQTRSIADKKFYKPPTEEAGAEPLFNRKALWASDKEPVFVVESPICALSVMQCGGLAVSLCGIGGTSKLVKDCKIKKPTSLLVLCLDNDEPGQKASEQLSAELMEMGVRYVVFNIAGECKDPNELLMQDAGKLKERIAAAKRRFTGLPREETPIFKLRESARELLERSFVLLNGPIPTLGERPFFTGCAGIRANLASSEITGTPSFATIMARRFGGSFDVCSNDPDSEEIASIVRKARNASCIVLNTSSALRSSGQLILMLALGKLKKPMVVIAMREPYELRYLPKHAAGIAAWEYSTRCTAAIAHCLTGQLRCTGRMPLGYFPLERINP